MKKTLAAVLAAVICVLCACAAKPAEEKGDFILATTAPVAEIVTRLLDGTGIETEQLITEPVSCLHDYSLSVEQMKKAESCGLAVISGLGLEDFMQSVLSSCPDCITAGEAVSPLPGEDGADPHIWMDPQNMVKMTHTVSAALQTRYPEKAQTISSNETAYCAELDALYAYGQAQLSQLSCRKLVTFHDGFSYFARAFDLEIAAAMELEPGSEPSAKELEAIISVVRENEIPALFVEASGFSDAASIIAGETGAKVFHLNMAMSLGSETYLDIMKQNIDTIKEALG
ncbi:MAG: metal ABC transporter substrate-binding protein [Clostridia bacterium]|nr:metal ABC transporter substrate-binding protein [Clostridia bacterium]